nr:nucleotide-binding alpha-beta plait domain-containing protein [Tanacetum cinerariifolium]
MARRVSDYRIRRIADRGNEEDGPDSRARGNCFYHNRRSVDRGNEKVDRDPGNISEIKGLRAMLIQMARRVSDYRIRRIADQGNEEDGPDSRARGDRFYHNRRSTDRGNEKVDRDEEEECPFVNKHPNFQKEPIVWVEEESCPVYNTDNEEKEDCDEDKVVNADYEEAPVFDDDQYEAATENISAQQDIQEELPTDEVQDNPIETPELQKLDVNNDLVDALNINKLDDSHVVEFDASSAGLSHTKILPVINQFSGHQDIDTVINDSNKSVFDTPSEHVEVEVSVVAESDVIEEPQFT